MVESEITDDNGRFLSFNTEPYSNIYMLNRYLDTDFSFLSLKTDRDYTSICLNSISDGDINYDCNYNYLKWEDGQNIIYLLKRANGILGKKVWAINNRRTNFLIFKFGLNVLIRKLQEKKIIELKKQIDEMHVQMRIHGGDLNIDITTSKLFWDWARNNDNENKIWNEKILLVLSKKQRDLIRKLKTVLGFNSGGIIGLICVIYSFESIFQHCRTGNAKVSDFSSIKDSSCESDLIKCDSEILNREKYFCANIINKIDFLFDEYYLELDEYNKKLLYLSKLKLEKSKMRDEVYRNGK